MYQDIAFVPGREYRDFAKNQENDPQFPNMVLLAGHLKSNATPETRNLSEPRFEQVADQILYKCLADNVSVSPELRKRSPLYSNPAVLEHRISPAGFMKTLAKQFHDRSKGGAGFDPWAIITKAVGPTETAILEITLADRFPSTVAYGEKAALLASYLILRDARPTDVMTAEGLQNLSVLLNDDALKSQKQECENLLASFRYVTDNHPFM